MSARFLLNVAWKTLLMLVMINLLFAVANPMPALGRLSLYNSIFPGRLRFPFGENPRAAYNLSLYSLEAMFASHELAGAGDPEGEFRVLVVGDSATWGTLLRPEETLPGQLNALGLICAGRPARFYNLGYPTLSLTKDLMVLDEACDYRPDLVIWPLTLQSFPREKQLASPLAANNAGRVASLIDRYGLSLDPHDPGLVYPDFWQRTIFGNRRALADLARLQLYGPAWAATGIDQEYPAGYTPAQRDLEPDPGFLGRQPPELNPDDLAWDALEGGLRASGAPVLLVNEPMMSAGGKNSDVRYNFFYPRWAYDAWRADLHTRAASGGWSLLDAWDMLPEDAFTNSAIHATPAGERALAEKVAGALGAFGCQ